MPRTGSITAARLLFAYPKLPDALGIFKKSGKNFALLRPHPARVLRWLVRHHRRHFQRTRISFELATGAAQDRKQKIAQPLGGAAVARDRDLARRRKVLAIIRGREAFADATVVLA